MNILAWVVFGLIIGIVATLKSNKKKSTSMLENTIIGIIGAIVGGFLGNIIFGVTITKFNSSAFIIAIAGAIGLVYVAKMIITTKKT